MIHARLWAPESHSVTAMITPIAAAASWFPRTAVRGDASRIRPKMNSAAHARYARSNASRLSIIAALLARPLLEHVQHPVRHQEAADDVDGAERDRDRAQHLDQQRVGAADHDDRAHDHDAVDRVGARHPRRV